MLLSRPVTRSLQLDVPRPLLPVGVLEGVLDGNGCCTSARVGGAPPCPVVLVPETDSKAKALAGGQLFFFFELSGRPPVQVQSHNGECPQKASPIYKGHPHPQVKGQLADEGQAAVGPCKVKKELPKGTLQE